MAPCTSTAISASTCPCKVSRAGCGWHRCSQWLCSIGMCSGLGVGCGQSRHGAGGAGAAQLDARLQAPSWPATCRRARAPHAPALPLTWRRRRRDWRIAEGEPPAPHVPSASPARGVPVTLPALCPQGAEELGAEAAQEEGSAQAYGCKAPAPLPGALGRAAAWPQAGREGPLGERLPPPPRTPARSASP